MTSSASPSRFSRPVVAWSILLLVGWLTAAFAPPVRADQPLDDYNLAVQLYRQSRWSFASEGFRKFIKDYPTHEKIPFARLYLGLALINQADFAAARDELRGFVKNYPENQNIAQARYRVAECSYLLNDLPAARIELETYLKAHSQDPLAERAWPYLGDVLLRQNEPAAARAAFTEAIQRYPKGALLDDAQFGLAKSLEAEKNYEAALATYRTLAAGESPRAAEALFQIGQREFETNQFEAAATTYQSLADRFPKNALAADALLNAGFALFRKEDFLAAAKAFERAAQAPQHALQAGYWQALSQKSQRHYSEASALLKQLLTKSEGNTAGNLGEAIAFQYGMCERLAGHRDEAQTALLAVVDRYPQGEYADDALHFASEIAIEEGNLTAAKERLDRFAKDYPRSGLRMYQLLLSGRLELALAGKASQNPTESASDSARHYMAAAQQFDSVLKETTLPKTRSQARYYLALTRQLQGDHAQALSLAAPLVEAVLKKEPLSADFAEVLVLQADSLLQTQQYPSAESAAKSYLELAPQGRQRSRAWSLQALAQAQDNRVTESLASLESLQKETPGSPLFMNTLIQMAELTERKADWPSSEILYSRLVTETTDAEQEAQARRGLGWAQYQQKEFVAAAETFATFLQKFSSHPLAAELSYYRAEALREQKLVPEAAAAFEETLSKYSPATGAAAGAEQQAPLVFAYRAGLQGARLWREAQKIEEADKAYAVLLERFPQTQQLDKLLDEWAILNYDAQRFDRADELFRRLIKETPDSELADNAQLSLAESDLIANRQEAAKAAFQSLRSSPKSDPAVQERAHYQLLVMALEQRQWEDVLQLGSDFRATFPESPLLAYVDYAAAEAVLADPMASPERLKLLVPVLAKMIEKLPDDSDAWAPRLWVLAAEAQFRLKEYDAIASTLNDLKTRHPESPLIYQVQEVWGRALKQQARFEEARTALEQVINDPAAFRTETAAKSQFLIAETWFLQQKWKEAFLAYQKVYASYAFPEWQSAALLQSAKCDEQLGNTKDAIATYDRMISEFPNSSHLNEARKRLEQAKLRGGS